MESTGYPVYIFEVDIAAGKVRCEQPEALSPEMQVLVENGIRLLGAKAGLFSRPAGATTASNPRVDRVNAAIQGRNQPHPQANDNGQRE